MCRFYKIAAMGLFAVGMVGPITQAWEKTITTADQSRGTLVPKLDTSILQEPIRRVATQGVELVPDEEVFAAEPTWQPAFEHFDCDDTGGSLTNAYLCAYLSNVIYSSQFGYSVQWEEALRQG